MTNIRLVVFDCDGVLVEHSSSWEFLHEAFGVTREAQLTKRMFNEGVISYYDWMYVDTLLWLYTQRGRVRKNYLEERLWAIRVREDAKKVVKKLKKKGILTIIVSSGIDLLVKRVAKELGVHGWISNKLIFNREGFLVPGGLPYVPLGAKRIVLEEIMKATGILREQIALVSDNESDKEAFSAVGLPIKYGKPSAPGSCVIIEKLDQLLDVIKEYEKNRLQCNC